MEDDLEPKTMPLNHQETDRRKYARAMLESSRRVTNRP